jgi:hypothetical protein
MGESSGQGFTYEAALDAGMAESQCFICDAIESMDASKKVYRVRVERL